MPQSTLVFHLQGLEALQAAMGDAATRGALAELERGVADIGQQVLTGMETLVSPPSTAPGLWLLPYRTPPATTLGGSTADRQEAVLGAATQLAGTLAREVFGTATASLARLRVHQLPGQADPARLDALLTQAPPAACGEDEAALQSLIRQGGLRTLLQPIVSFPDGRLLGYEALSRGPQGSPLERADQLFGAAARCGLSRELEIACAWQALNWHGQLPQGQWLTVNLSAPSLRDPELRHALARPGIVVELTEHLPLHDAQALLPLLAELRAGGAQVALDDTGCGFADQQAAEVLRPDFIKLCITIVRNVSRNPAVLEDLGRSIGHLRRLGIRVLAEGMETAREAEILGGFAIDYAQGWLYGKPRAAGEFLPSPAP